MSDSLKADALTFAGRLCGFILLSTLIVIYWYMNDKLVVEMANKGYCYQQANSGWHEWQKCK